MLVRLTADVDDDAQRATRASWLEVLGFGCFNAAVLLLFVCKPFVDADGEVAHFMY